MRLIRRHPWRAALSGVACLLVACVAGSWHTATRHVASEVSVTWMPDSPHCVGTTITRKGLIRATPPMRCTVVVDIRNDGRVPVRLVSVTGAYGGPHTGTALRVGNADGSTDYGLDAVWKLNRTLAAGAHTTHEIVLVYQPSGCNFGVTAGLPHWPVVHIRVYGHGADIAANRGVRFTGDDSPGCHKADSED